MSDFTFTDDGREVRSIMQCQNCEHIQLDRHFGDDGKCPMCQAIETEELQKQKLSSGMSNFQYRTILTELKQECSGVGQATVSGIQDEYPEGDDFLDACRNAYDEQAYDELTPVSGVGEKKARNICLHIADMREWEDGLAETSFKIAQ
jgi:hypothetical protein